MLYMDYVHDSHCTSVLQFYFRGASPMPNTVLNDPNVLLFPATICTSNHANKFSVVSPRHIVGEMLKLDFPLTAALLEV